MHFFYLDEAGCNGADLENAEQPVFVMAGISVSDEKWVKTTEKFEELIAGYFGEDGVPNGFELHSHELLSPKGEGFFKAHDRDRRNKLALDILKLVEDRGHHLHQVAIRKSLLAEHGTGDEHDVFDGRVPYLLAFDYMTTLINERVRGKGLGRSARGIIIIDEKELFEEQVAAVTRFRRFEVVPAKRVKHVVEFSYSIDSRKHPMVQISDLVAFCTKKFFELDQGLRDEWHPNGKKFYAQCFAAIHSRLFKKNFQEQSGKHAKAINALAESVIVFPRHGWKAHYEV